MLERQCVRCHRPGVDGEGAKTDLTAAAAYNTLIDYGGPKSVRQHVLDRWNERRSQPGAGASLATPLVALLDRGHYEVQLTADDTDRLLTWLDTYGQVRGSFSPEQEERLRQLRQSLQPLLTRTDRP